MSDSVLNRIRQNRNRAAVPPRDDVLIAKTPTPAKGEAAEDPEAIEPLPEKPEKVDQTSNSLTGSTLNELKAQLASLPETQRHSAIVLEKQLDQELTRYCKENRITVEVFLEAAWTQVSIDLDLQQKILAEAQRRYKFRKEAGKLRRLITMLEGKVGQR